MVRTASFRTHHQIQSAYMHRASTYRRRPGYILLSEAEQLFTQPMSEDISPQYVLPPRQPTPDVILRSDIMPRQRSRVAL